MTDFFEQHASARDKWEAEMDIRAEEEMARMSNPEIEKSEKDENPFDDYFDNVVEVKE